MLIGQVILMTVNLLGYLFQVGGATVVGKARNSRMWRMPISTS